SPSMSTRCRGTKPGELSVEQPTRFDLVVNPSIAKALGLTIPEAFLPRADEPIEQTLPTGIVANTVNSTGCSANDLAKVSGQKTVMGDASVEISFGIGTMLRGGKPATAVVVNDQVAALADIVVRPSAPSSRAPTMRELLGHWDRWHDWLR